ncbi:MAG TPA: ribosome silencing factor [Gammaproteobacteria bacterium]|jgi:ribosome-associated protein|nr:ribosome silencing factor [Gammaproteobacteria bacterium]
MSKTTNQKQPPTKQLVTIVDGVLEDLKAEAVVSLDVKHLTSVTDVMVIATGRSSRHVRAVADALVERCKENHHRPLGIEGEESGEWILVDLADVIVHVMLPKVRDFYELEKLWDLESVEDAERSS